jgi:metallo-beta-lactamase family protein
MKIHFLGAARTVTGSCYVIETASARFAVDCGMHQGNEEIEKRNWDMSPYKPDELDFILLTHAHIDHTGLLPRAVKFGFKGPVYVTPPTADLLQIMLLDSAHIQEMEAEWENRKRTRHGTGKVEPLYTQADAQAAQKLFKTVTYNRPLTPARGVTATFHDAGHILGSAFIELNVSENGDSTRLVFSGDLGRPDQLLVREPSVVESADYLLLESTYGDRDHKDPGNSRAELAEAIAYSYGRGEKVVIPAFAVERSQEIIYTLFSLAKEGKLPKDMPVYLDSPLAIQATRIFRGHPEYMDEDARALIKNGEDPLSLPNLVFTPSAEESKAINESRRPAVIISASGMCNAGRVKHHLKHNLWRPGASVVFVGYQAVGTPGRKIVDGAKRIEILGESVAVKAKVFTIGGFSGHAGQSQILEWLGNFRNSAMKIFLVHGEAKAQDILAALIKDRFGYTVHIPDYLEECELKPGLAPAIAEHPEKARPRIDWGYLLAETERLLADLKRRQGEVAAKPWVDQTELRDRLLKINGEIVELSSEL